ncbi:MAG: 30S ribosomal protein S8 [Candidatus Margulisiibacteriota bacterium]|jgi:small subunit ribosomal protein S8
MSAVTDTIGDMLTRIRNAIRVDQENVDITASKIKTEIARILKDEGYIKKYSVLARGPKKILRIELKYGPNQEHVITNLKRVSKPGRRIYLPKSEIPRVLSGYGISIISTSRGMMTGKAARTVGVGGEVLCEVW